MLQLARALLHAAIGTRFATCCNWHALCYMLQLARRLRQGAHAILAGSFCTALFARFSASFFFVRTEITNSQKSLFMISRRVKNRFS